MTTFIMPGKPFGKQRKASDDQVAAAYAATGSVWAASNLLGMCGQSVHERVTRLGLCKGLNRFTDAEKALLAERYAAAASAGKLAELAAEMGRTKPFLCRQAGRMGLTDPKRAKPFLAEIASKRQRAWLANNEHPRGSAGLKHTPETKQRISELVTKRWAAMSEEDRSALTLRQMKARVAKQGSLATPREGTTWKAGWREIGGYRKYYRSRWEANYARYLEWLKVGGHIQDWKHEPETFWFEAIKRGVRSYLPDFRVWENDGNSRLHEVKGWMDARSKTTLKRMKKYHPQEVIVLVDTKAYRAIEKKVSGLVEGWE